MAKLGSTARRGLRKTDVALVIDPGVQAELRLVLGIASIEPRMRPFITQKQIKEKSLTGKRVAERKRMARVESIKTAEKALAETGGEVTDAAIAKYLGIAKSTVSRSKRGVVCATPRQTEAQGKRK